MKKRIIFKLSRDLIFPVFLFFGVLQGFSESTSNPAPRARQDEIKEIESKLSKERQKFDEFKSQEKNILALLSDVEQEVAEKKRAIEKLSKKIRIARTEVKNLEKRLANLGRLLKNVETRLTKRLVALYKYARRGYIKILANVSDLNQFWQRLKYLKAIMEEDQKALVKLADEEDRYKREISRIKEQLVEKEAINKEEKRQLFSLREDLEKKVIRLIKIHKEKEFYETAVKELQLAAQNLKQTLLNIEKKETYKITQPSHFADSKGKLPFPLEGKIIRGDKLSGSTGLSFDKGIFIEGSFDTKVKAIFPGRVDFSGRIKGYGELIIINHGSRYFTLSAHLSQRKKEEGNVVEGGEVIGQAGRHTSSKGARLYFEIRRAGKNLDPLKWLRAH